MSKHKMTISSTRHSAVPHLDGQRDPQTTTLGTPLQLPFSKQWAPNRLLKAALTERLASFDIEDIESRGIPTEDLAHLYEEWAKGGCGIIVTGNIMIDYINIEAAGNMIVAPSDQPHGPRFEAFTKLANATRSHGALLLGQINHPGRQVHKVYQPNPISASDVPLGENMVKLEANPPRSATKAELETIVSSFAHTASYLFQAGFNGIQIHAAHGYLLSQFLSLSTNKRYDEYGPSSVESRSRLLIEICHRIRVSTPPSFVLSVKLNSVEFEEGGMQPEDAGALCHLLDSAGVDLIELSGGTYTRLAWQHSRESTRRREGFFMEFADAIVAMNKSHKSKIYVTGGFRSSHAMLDALRTVDGIGLGRPSTQQLLLPRELALGNEREAAKVAYDYDAFHIGALVCSAQIREVAEGRGVMDAADEKQLEDFMGLVMKSGNQDSKLVDYKPLCFPEKEVCFDYID